MKKLLILMAMLPMGCSHSSTEPAERPSPNGIQFDALAEQVDGSVVAVSVTATNVSEQRQRVELLGGGCLVRKVVWRGTDDAPILDDRDQELPCQDIAAIVELGSGEVRSIGDQPLRFDLSAELGDEFVPGEYRVAALLTAGDDFLLVPAGIVEID